MSNSQAILSKHKIVPVISLDNAADALPLAKALIAGGLPVAEVTFRTDAAEESIRQMAQLDELFVGAGTVLTPAQVDQAAAAGAKFVVSPGFNPKVVQHCQKIGMPIIPGVSNPTDIEMAIEHGLEVVKFFPAEAFGGVSTLKAISAPYPQLKFMPTGGINTSNIGDYLAMDSVLACGGSWMVKSNLFADGDFASVEQITREAVELVSKLG